MLKRLIKGIGANAFAQLVMVLVQLSMVPVFASAWGETVYGAWLLIYTIPAYLALSDLGFASAAANEMTMRTGRGDNQGATAVFHTAWAVTLSASAVIFLIVFAAIATLPDRMFALAEQLSPDEIRGALICLSMYGIVTLQGSIFLAGFRCAGLYHTGVILSALVTLGEALLVSAIVLAGGSIVSAALGFLVFRSAGVIASGILLKRLVPWLGLGLSRFSWCEMRLLAPKALPVMGLPFAQSMSLQGTVLVLGAAASLAAVPAFASVRTLTRLGFHASLVVVHAAMPEFSRAYAARDEQQKAAIIILTSLASVCIIFPASGLFAIFGVDLVLILTAGVVEPSPNLVFTMAAVMLLQGLSQPIANLLLAINQHAIYSYTYCALALASLPLTYALSTKLAAYGAALSSLILEAALLMILLLVSRRLLVSREVLLRVARAQWPRLKV